MDDAAAAADVLSMHSRAEFALERLPRAGKSARLVQGTHCTAGQSAAFIGKKAFGCQVETRLHQRFRVSPFSRWELKRASALRFYVGFTGAECVRMDLLTPSAA